MSTQDSINPMSPLTPPRVLNTYKDRQRRKQQQQHGKKPAPRQRPQDPSKHIDEFV